MSFVAVAYLYLDKYEFIKELIGNIVSKPEKLTVSLSNKTFFWIIFLPIHIEKC